jgi:hypothetical protein
MRGNRIRGVVAAALVAATTMIGVAATTSSAATLSPSVSGCDVLVTAPVGHDCLLPWPNDAYTVAAKTATGLRLDLTSAETPANTSGVHIDPVYQDQGDGFSPGSEIITDVPDLSIANSGIAGSTDIAASLAPDAPIVLVDMRTGTRVPYFAELDAQNPDPATQLLLVHPAVALTEGDRYAVVLRNLVDTSGAAIPPAPSTLAALAGTLVPASRGAYLKNLIDNELHGVLGGTVPYMAWDFTVASEMSIAGPALAMRDQAFAKLGTSGAPPFTVTSDTTLGNTRTVSGTFQVPLFLTAATPTSQMDVGKNGLPKINGKKTWTANFDCVMRPTVQSGGPALPVVYGHGLLGDASEVEGGNFSDKLNFDIMGCGTDYVGMSQNDLLNVARALGDMSYFHTLADHTLQGIINTLYLGRLLNSPHGFVTSTAFRDASGTPLFAVGKTAYLGYSQGGINGGAVSALSNEWSRVVLGQPGMDYGGLLLDRSVDWSEFEAVYGKAYPNVDDQQIGLQLAQLLWDRGENDGYAHHLTSHPYPGTKAKQVLIIENYGDHQVTNLAAEMLGRTIGAAEYAPALSRPGLSYSTAFGLPALDQSKPQKAALELWDYGTPTPPADNLAPSTSAYGDDPHDFGRALPLLDGQINAFLRTGIVPDVCGSAACQSAPGIN